MKFLCLGYYDEKKFDRLSKQEVDELVQACHAHDEALRASGNMVLVASLAPSRATKSLRPKNGKPFATDGPYAETKEQIGAFFILEAKDLEEAARVAALHPAAHLGEHVGWGVEVRPIDHYQQP